MKTHSTNLVENVPLRHLDENGDLENDDDEGGNGGGGVGDHNKSSPTKQKNSEKNQQNRTLPDIKIVPYNSEPKDYSLL